MSTPILRIKDKDGQWQPIQAIIGESAYQIAVRNGFKGTEAEWLESLKGGGGGTEGVGVEIVQTTGDREDAVMSQKATTEAINNALQADIYPEADLGYFDYKSNYGAYGIELATTFTLKVGEYYKVTWDNETYTCIAQDASVIAPSAVALGNGTSLGLSGNNEPFVIGAVEGGAVFLSTVDTERKEHSVRIYQDLETLIANYVDNYISEALGGDY